MKDGEKSNCREKQYEEEEEEDSRREAAIACAGTGLKSSGGLTSQQLSKFQELHRRRLQIKSDSKVNKKAKERCHTRQRNVRDALDTINPQSSSIKDSCASGEDNFSSTQQENLTLKSESQRRPKLHWGLDTKERWERKANM